MNDNLKILNRYPPGFFAMNGLIVSIFQVPAMILMSRFNTFSGMAIEAAFYGSAYILASYSDGLLFFSGILFLISAIGYLLFGKYIRKNPIV